MPLARVHAANENAARQAAVTVTRAYAIGDAPRTPPVLMERIDSRA
jgi:hypothetical protein